MNDCISRAALLKHKTLIPGFVGEYVSVQNIQDAPAVTPEVPHGRWKYYHKQNKAVCTNCSFERDLDANLGAAIACPNCGARMGGDGE